jgi:TonB family protein
MASPAEIANVLPDTLPADFGEWDGEGSTATLPVHTSDHEAARGPIAVSRPAANIAEPLITPTPLPTLKRVTPSRAPAASFPDDEAYLRRLRSITNVVDKLPPVAPEAQAATVAIPPVENRPPLEESPMPEPDVPFSRSAIFRSADVIERDDSDEVEDENEEEKRTRRKWIMVVGGAGISIVLVAFQLFHSGTVSAVKHMVAPQPSATDSLPTANTDENLPSTHPTPAKPSAAADKQQKTSIRTDTEETADADPAPVRSTMMHDQLIAPSRISQDAKSQPGSDAPPSAGIGVAEMEALGGNGAVSNVFNGQGQSRVKAVAGKVTVSAGVAVGMLIHKTPPTYPPIAKSARVSGTVVLQGTISKTGSMENLRVVTGPAMLRQSALDAVKTWRYRPYLLSNVPTEVETQVNVVFDLNR